MKSIMLGIRFFLLIAIIIYPVCGMSAEISLETAREVAENYLQHRVIIDGKWDGSKQPSITGIELIEYKDTPVAYDVKVSPRGHLLIPYYDDFSPVLLYSDKSEFIPSRMKVKGSVESWILPEIYNTYNIIRQKTAALNQDERPGYDLSRVAKAWKIFKGARSESRAAVVSAATTDKFATFGPLLTTTWDQPSPYNQYTPGDTGCTHTLTGCVATAWSQLMKYWNWPDSGTGSHSYTWNGQTLSANFSHAYNWASMPNNLTASSSATEKDAVARLISDVGIAADMDYGCDSSSSNAYADDDLDVYFKYKSSMQQIPRGSLTADEWFNLFKAEFDALPPRPIIMSIFIGNSGHEIVADGYQTEPTNKVHVNLGWSGSYNGYYDVTNNWTTGSYTWEANSQVIVTHIEPDNPNAAPVVLTTIPADGVTGVAVAAPVTATFDKAMDASTINTPATTFTLKAGNVNVAGSVGYSSSTHTATFDPSTSLSPNTLYTATITTGAEDSTGLPLAANKVWSFTTAGDETTLLTEAFTTGILPVGWSVTDNAGTGAEWVFNDPAPRGNQTGGAGGFAIADSDYAGSVNMDTELRTPSLDLSNYANPTLNFKTLFNSFQSEVADVDVSINGASGPWTNVWRKTLVDYTGSETIDISSLAAGKANVMIRFRYYNANYEWYWEVDDVVITAVNNPALPPVRFYDGSIYRYHQSLQDAYNAGGSSCSIQSRAVALPASPFNLNLGKTILLKGGYDNGYNNNTGGGYTSMQGILTLVSGSLTVDNLIIK